MAQTVTEYNDNFCCAHYVSTRSWSWVSWYVNFLLWERTRANTGSADQFIVLTAFNFLVWDMLLSAMLWWKLSSSPAGELRMQREPCAQWTLLQLFNIIICELSDPFLFPLVISRSQRSLDNAGCILLYMCKIMNQSILSKVANVLLLCTCSYLRRKALGLSLYEGGCLIASHIGTSLSLVI